jgi:hypothetical protein
MGETVTPDIPGIDLLGSMIAPKTPAVDRLKVKDHATGKTKVFGDKSSGQIITIPPPGYKGIAYSTQEVNLAVNNNFSKPFEGVFSNIPASLDLVSQVGTGISLNNSKFSSLKYWTGTEPPDINIKVVFETRMDSFFDVYMPVLFLTSMALPGVTKEGFFTSPVPTLKIIAKDFKKLADELTTKGLNAIEKNVNLQVNKDLLATVKGKLNSISGSVDEWTNIMNPTGYETSLLMGNGLNIPNIIIKSINTTFSQELAYAPLLGLNLMGENPTGTALFQPYSLPEALVSTVCQTLCVVYAQGINALTSVSNVLGQFGVDEKTLKNIKNILPMPSFPLKAEVDMNIELMYPVTKIGSGVTGIDQLIHFNSGR